MNDYVRQCALPGCDVPIDDIPGRPARRYCTAAHRAAARQARRASMQPDQQARLAETLPWLREPDPEPVLVRPAAGHVDPEPVRAVRVPTAPPESRGLAARLGDRLPRRRRAIAVIGAAGILAGGYAVTSSQSTEVAGPTQQTPQGESSDGWAARAQVTLTSVDKQLDTIAQTEAAWNAMPEHATVSTPAAVAELMDRKALLERRKAALQSQLDSYRALARTKADLELSEQNLDAVEKALRDAPTTGAVSSPDEASALAALQEQRDLRIRQRDAKKLELAGIEGNVEKAARAPLPDDGQQTTVVSDKVMDVIHNGGRGGGRPASPTPGPRRPEVLAGGREGEQGQERQATTTSAPPDPRGPRDESAERRAEPQPRPAAAPKGPVGKVVDTVDGVLGGGKQDPNTGERSRGPVGKVADTVGGVLTGGKSDAKPDAADKPAQDKPDADKPAGDKPASEKSSEQPKGPVGKVVDTLGGAVEGLIGGKGQDQKESSQKESSQKKSSQKESAQKESKPEQDAPKQSAPTSNTASNDRAAATSGSAQVRSRSAETSVPTGDALAAAMPGVELAMAIVNSVPGGEAAAPAVEAAMRQAAAQYAEQSNASTTTQKSQSSQSSRKTPTHLTTTVVDDSGSTQKRSSGSSSGGSGGTSYSGTSSKSGSDGSSSSKSSKSSTSTRSGSDGSSGTSGSDGSSSSKSSKSSKSGSDGSSSGTSSSDSDSGWGSGTTSSSSGSNGSDSSSSGSSDSGSGSSSDWSGSSSATDYSSTSDWSN